MNICKYKLDKNNEVIQSAILDRNELHKFVWSFFKGFNDFCISRERLGLIYRLLNVNNEYFLVMYSEVKPNNVPSGVDVIYEVLDKTMKDKLKTLNFVKFNVETNPTREDKYIKGRKNREDWFRNKAVHAGFEILDFNEIEKDFVTVNKKSNNFSFGVCEFYGTLKVVDFDKFYKAICQGFGPEKAYGMGLMLFGV